MIIFTVVNIVVIELVFFIAEALIKRNNSCLSFVTTFLLGLTVLLVSFGGNVTTLLNTMMTNGHDFNVIEILLFFANMFYGYMRGLDRIAKMNKKYGNL